MKQETEDIIRNKLADLPSEVLKAITEVDIRVKLQEIMRTHSLRVDQGGALEREVLLMLIGLETPTTFLDNIVKELHVPRETASRVVEDVNQNILKNIREVLIEHVAKQKEAAEIGALLYEESEGALPVSPTTPQQESAPMNVPAPRTLAADIAKAKLEGSFHLPPDSVTVRPTTNDQRPTIDNRQPTTNDQRLTTDNQRPTTNSPQPTTGTGIYKGSDPYREALK
ncbi:MAG: hypothetical protein AAB460_01255 [Patescibacteria group bacterium]